MKKDKDYTRVMALPAQIRKELNYLAFMKPEQSPTFYHNIAVAGERLIKWSDKRTAKEFQKMIK